MNRALVILVIVALLLAGMPAAMSPARAQSDYAVVTHYPDYGGMEPAPKDAVQVAYGVFNNRLDDYYAVDSARAEEVLAQIEDETGFPVLMRNDWAEAEEGLAALQIVNNVPVEGALYTLFLPPGWTKTADLPVLLSGNGAGHSNNRRLYGSRETIPAVASVVGVKLGGTGFIVAISNCGGTESQGVDEPTLRSVGAFLNWIDANGGDKTNVITAGGSRGGGSALMWAINPLGLDYNVHTVFAVVPPTHYGSLARTSILTYPAMAGIGSLISHDEASWRYDDPASAVNQFPSPFLEAILGTGDPGEADLRSPISLAEGLRGKQVLIAGGAHDAFFPLAHFIEFDHRLTELDIPHTTIITLAQGHESARFFEETLYLYLTSLSTGFPARLPTGRYIYIDRNPAENDQVSLASFFQERGIEADSGKLPVIVQFPYRIGADNPADVVICGAPGSSVDLQLSGPDGTPIFAWAGEIPEAECVMQSTAFEVRPGTYSWTLTVDGEAINPTNTPSRAPDGCGLPAVTIVEAEQPHPDDTFAFDGNMSFGLDQYSGQPETCTVE